MADPAAATTANIIFIATPIYYSILFGFCQQKSYLAAKILTIPFVLTIPHQGYIIYIVRKEKEIIYIAEFFGRTAKSIDKTA